MPEITEHNGRPAAVVDEKNLVIFQAEGVMPEFVLAFKLQTDPHTWWYQPLGLSSRPKAVQEIYRPAFESLWTHLVQTGQLNPMFHTLERMSR